MTDAERARRNAVRERALLIQRRAAILRHGLIGICALVAIVMLASFYSVVSGAVDRASRQRLAAADGGNAPALAALPRAARGNSALLARVGN